MRPPEIRPGIRRLFRLAVRRDRSTTADMDEEIRLHIALRARQLIGEGHSPDAARAEAEARFGLRDEVRHRLHRSAMRRETRMARLERLDAIRQDVRYAWRGLRNNPGFAAIAVITLALGIGANTAIFSVVDAVMLRSLPVRHPEQLVQISMGDGRVDEFSNPLWEALRDRQDTFSGMFAFARQRFDLASGGEARPVEGTWISGGFFDVLGVRPAAGRLLHSADDQRGCAPVAVLSHGFWERAYGGDAGVVGKTISLDGHPFEIVGVADPGFSGIEVGHAVQLYAPLCAKAIVDGGGGGLDDRQQWYLRVMGRQHDGLSVAQTRARIAAIAPAVFTAAVPPGMSDQDQREFVRGALNVSPAATGYSDMRLQYRTALITLLAVVGIVLLIACANVANLLLARAVGRRREIAIRMAIGAGRVRLVRQLLTESVLLALVGGALGLLLAKWAASLLLRLLSTRDTSVFLDLAINGRVLAFTLAVATATALLFGLAPAWRATRVDLHSAMTANDGGADDVRGRFTSGKSLVVGQIALSLVLLLGAGLLLSTLKTLTTLDPGFERNGVLLASVDMRDAHYPEEQLRTVKQAMLERLRATPGIRSVGASAITPISGAGWNGGVSVDGYTPKNRRDASAFFNAVSDGYFATLGTRLLTGRDFGVHDVAGAPPVVVINEAMARKFFGGANPVGRRIGINNGPGGEQQVTVIGMVRDAKYRSLREDMREVVYLPMAQDAGAASPSINLELRGLSTATSLIPTVTGVMAQLNPTFSITYTTLAAQVDASLARERLLATLSGFFGTLALLLAVVGLYGTMSYMLAQRRKEIGVRIALGAARGRVMRLVLGEAGRLVAAGVMVGGAIAYLATRWVTPFLFGVSPLDPVTWALATAILAGAALAAAALPAWRAATLDPMSSIRTD
ncbi:MAG TPA: ABC transporter permease [Gemmatimonadaceae bacterium]|nr:ABC transporter permease [Gemmatimonadaceae bacterium]